MSTYDTDLKAPIAYRTITEKEWSAATPYLGQSEGPPKRCNHCKQEKPATPVHFYRDRNRPDGLMAKCKTCHIEMQRGPRAFTGRKRTTKALGSHGVTIRAGEGVLGAAPALVFVAPPAPPQLPIATPATTPEEKKEPLTVEMVEPSRSIMGKITLGEYMALEEAPSVWVGPAGVSVMASQSGAGVEFHILTPFGDAPSFHTDASAAHYIAALLVDKHAVAPGAALDGVMLLSGGKRK